MLGFCFENELSRVPKQWQALRSNSTFSRYMVANNEDVTSSTSGWKVEPGSANFPML